MKNKQEHKLVSTLICTYNAESFFDATIRSVIDQTYANQEILIRDDCSSDDTLQLLHTWQKIDSRIRIFSEMDTKRGPYGGLNYLLDQAKGTYIAIQDHDDIWHPEKLEKQVSFLETHDEFEGVGSAYTIFIEKYDVVTIKNIISKKYGKSIAHHTSLMYKASKKRYNTSLQRFVDLDFMLHVLGEIKELDGVYMMHRERADGNNLFTQRCTGLKNNRKLLKHQKSFIAIIYYIYRSIVGEDIVRWMSVYLFSRSSYQHIKETDHVWLKRYLV